MGEQTLVVELGQVLKRAVDVSGQLAMERMRRGDYTGARVAMEWTQSMDSIATRVSNANGHPVAAPVSVAQLKKPTAPAHFPYYYREPDQLVKVGRSDKGDGKYKHPVPRNNFDEVIATLIEFASNDVRFDTKDLQNRLPRIPRHQPVIVLDVLEQQRLILNTRRGQWAFIDRAGFAAASQSVWDSVPQE